MSKRYIFLAGLLIVMSLGLVFVPAKKETIAIHPKQMLIKINNPARYLSTYEVAKRIVERDPSLFLIDVRPKEQFTIYSVPGSINIPIKDISNPEWQDYLDQDGMNIIFYSNGDVSADKAWLFATEQGGDHLYVMRGGMNEWYRSIIKPIPPEDTAPTEEFEKYAFARGACAFFMGSSASIDNSTMTDKKTVVVRKKKKKAAEGGC